MNLSRILLLIATVITISSVGCAPQYSGPKWTYYSEEQFESKPESFEPEIFFSSDVMQHARTSSFMDEQLVPPHMSIASVAGRGLVLEEVLDKARELGADGVIVTRIGDTGYILGVGSFDMGKEVAGATFIHYREVLNKRESKGLFER